jgi:hypothetical protein
MRSMTILAAAIAMSPLAALAADNAITLYGGYRSTGGFTDVDTGQSIDVKATGSIAASFDFAVDASRQVQFFVSHQGSKFEVDALPGSAAATLNGRSISVTYLHIGGTNFFDGPIGRGPYVVGGFGATQFSPRVSGYSSEWRPSMSLGLGYQLPLAANLALRFEARAYLTLVNSEGGLFCSGGCLVTIRGDTFTQAEALIGLSLAF